MAKFTEFTGFTDAERDYLRRQPLGRLATVDASGQPQANPVGYFLQDDGTLLIGGAASPMNSASTVLPHSPTAPAPGDSYSIEWHPDDLGISEVTGMKRSTCWQGLPGVEHAPIPV